MYFTSFFHTNGTVSAPIQGIATCCAYFRRESPCQCHYRLRSFVHPTIVTAVSKETHTTRRRGYKFLHLDGTLMYNSQARSSSVYECETLKGSLAWNEAHARLPQGCLGAEPPIDLSTTRRQESGEPFLPLELGRSRTFPAHGSTFSRALCHPPRRSNHKLGQTETHGMNPCQQVIALHHDGVVHGIYEYFPQTRPSPSPLLHRRPWICPYKIVYPRVPRFVSLDLYPVGRRSRQRCGGVRSLRLSSRYERMERFPQLLVPDSCPEPKHTWKHGQRFNRST